MPHYTFGDQKLFRSLERAADFAVKNGLSPTRMWVLKDGKLVRPHVWEMNEIKILMRDRGVMVW